MDDVLDAVDELRQQRNLSLEWLDVRMITRYLKRKDEVCLLMMNFLLNEVIEMMIEIVVQLLVHNIAKTVSLCLLFGQLKVVKQTIGHVKDVTLLD